jgi:hypothetical protein
VNGDARRAHLIHNAPAHRLLAIPGTPATANRATPDRNFGKDEGEERSVDYPLDIGPFGIAMDGLCDTPNTGAQIGLFFFSLLATTNKPSPEGVGVEAPAALISAQESPHLCPHLCTYSSGRPFDSIDLALFS